MRKFIFVIGGVISGVGKGVTSASIAQLIQSKGYRVTNVKCDMYVNLDAGTIRPTEHGEVFVGHDGIEADQDLGNYERFTNNRMTRINYITTGQVYQEVIRRERNLEFDGEDVEVVPDIPNEIIRRLNLAADRANADVTVVEFGGTVGEYQVLLFLEAARIMKLYNPLDIFFILVSYIPYPKHIGETKTKPTQYAVRSLNSAGIQPDLVIARGEVELDDRRREVLSKVCNLRPGSVISAPDLDSIYDVPLYLDQQDVTSKIFSHFNLTPKTDTLQPWREMSAKIKNTKRSTKIAIVGKYFTTGEHTLADSYISVIETLKHAGWNNDTKLELKWLNSQDYETNPAKVEELKNYAGVVVPGGFGSSGVDGILHAIQYCREFKIPYLGLCYGMQLATIEFARNVLGIEKANTTEINPNTADPIIYTLPGQDENIENKRYGGTMRLGAYTCILKKGSKVHAAYQNNVIIERHRHRYEFNDRYSDRFIAAGMDIVGQAADHGLVEIIELKDHPFFIGVQFHPEFKSTLLEPHPLFMAFIKAALGESSPNPEPPDLKPKQYIHPEYVPAPAINPQT